MGSTMIAIILVASIVLILSIMGIGGSFWDKVNADIDQRLKLQRSSGDADLSTQGNYAEDTGTRVCDLQLNFVGSISGNGIDALIGSVDGVKLFMGSNPLDFLIGDLHNNAIMTYKWLCTNTGLTQTNWLEVWQNSVSSNSVVGFTQANIFDSKFDNDVRIWFFLEGSSLNTGKILIGKASHDDTVNQNPPVFSDFQLIKGGTTSPAEFRVTVRIFDTTEDDYTIEFWNDKYPINDKRVNHIFTAKICKPGTELTLAQLVDLRIVGETDTRGGSRTVSTDSHEETTTTITTKTDSGSTTTTISSTGETIPPTSDGTVTTGSTSSTPVAVC